MAKHLISSNRTIQSMKPTLKRLNDGAGLHLRQRQGRKHWYQDYSVDRVRYTLSLGAYPEIGLAEARRRSHAMRTDVALGINPSERRKASARVEREREDPKRPSTHQGAQPGSFEHLAREWFKLQSFGWSDSYADSVMVRLECHVFPALGHHPISAIHRKEFTALFMAIDNAGTTVTAKRVQTLCRRICDYALATGHLESNTCPGVKETIRKAITKHHAAITSPAKLGEFMRSLDAYPGSFVVNSAIKLGVQTFLHSKELRWAEWSEFDLDSQEWRVPAARMKGTKEDKQNREHHLVPLSRQAVGILKELHRITGGSRYVFAGQGWKNPVISENTVNSAIRAMGFSTRYDQTSHGFRATARTLLVEQLGWHRDIVELQLDHVVLDANGEAYNRTRFHQWRTEMMQDWSDYLDQVRDGIVLPAVEHHSRPLIEAIKKALIQRDGRPRINRHENVQEFDQAVFRNASSART